MGVAGRYILTHGVFDEIRNQPRVGGEIQLTGRHRPADGARSGVRIPVRRQALRLRQQREGFLEATVELALQHPEVGATFRTYLKTC